MSCILSIEIIDAMACLQILFDPHMHLALPHSWTSYFFHEHVTNFSHPCIVIGIWPISSPIPATSPTHDHNVTTRPQQVFAPAQLQNTSCVHRIDVSQWEETQISHGTRCFTCKGRHGHKTTTRRYQIANKVCMLGYHLATTIGTLARHSDFWFLRRIKYFHSTTNYAWKWRLKPNTLSTNIHQLKLYAHEG
jgi:hypothetical protein